MMFRSSTTKNSPSPIRRVGCHRFGRSSCHSAKRPASTTGARSASPTQFNAASRVIHQIVVVVTTVALACRFWSRRWNQRWSIPDPARALVLPPGSALPPPGDTGAPRSDAPGRLLATALVESDLDAGLPTKLPSTDKCWLQPSPTSTHCRTICSNNCSNSSDSWKKNLPQASRERGRCGSPDQPQPGEPPPR